MQVDAVLEAARAAIAANTWCFAITLAADGTPHARLIQPVYRPRMLGHRVEAYAARAAG